MSNRRVKGILFSDYVRMVRARKDVDWSSDLLPQDKAFLDQQIDPNAWYPMETFERLGNGILRHNANGDVQAARIWGRVSVEKLAQQNPTLLAAGDPMETLNRFRVLRASYFDFDALDIIALIDDHARIVISYHMSARAEEAASYQTMGFFERLLEMTGAKSVKSSFAEMSWAGAPRTVLELDWS